MHYFNFCDIGIYFIYDNIQQLYVLNSPPILQLMNRPNLTQVQKPTFLR